MRVNEFLRARRKAAGLTLATVAARTGLSISFLCDVEKGRRGLTLKTAVSIASALGATSWEGIVERLLEEWAEDAGYPVSVNALPDKRAAE